MNHISCHIGDTHTDTYADLFSSPSLECVIFWYIGDNVERQRLIPDSDFYDVCRVYLAIEIIACLLEYLPTGQYKGYTHYVLFTDFPRSTFRSRFLFVDFSLWKAPG